MSATNIKLYWDTKCEPDPPAWCLLYTDELGQEVSEVVEADEADQSGAVAEAAEYLSLPAGTAVSIIEAKTGEVIEARWAS